MNNKIKISDIPCDIKYIGYLWMSDKPHPLEYHTPSVLKEILEGFSDTTNPFIIEGQLCDEKTEVSYSIKYVDGKYIVIKYDLKNIPEGWIPDEEDKEYISNSRLRASKILFRQYWKPEIEDSADVNESLCLGMPVLVPGPLVFVGFKYLKK